MFDALFRFFFDLSPVVFSQGEFRFAASTGSYVAAAAVAVAAGLTVLAYRNRTAAGPGDRVALAAIRLAILAIILVCMFRPLLVVKAAVPQQNFLGVLLDDSRSMQIADVDGQPRAAFVKSEFGAADRGLLKALSDRFTVRTFRFSSAATRTTQESDLTFADRSRASARRCRACGRSWPAFRSPGLVMVTDGADTADAALGDAILGLKAEGLPVFTVGVGRETLSKDIQVGRVVTPKTALKGTTLMVDVVLSQSGFDGQKVTLDVEDEGTLVSTQQVSLPDAGTPASIPVRFTVNEAGPRVLRFRVSPQPGELVTENNAREALIDVRDRKEKILYFEGEPRFEIQVHPPRHSRRRQHHRHQPDSHRRQQVHAAGRRWPGRARRGVSEDARGAVRLSLARSSAASKRRAFTGDQLKMISEFVDRRGGGLLMLGGPRAFAEGGYAGHRGGRCRCRSCSIAPRCSRRAP